MRTSLRTAAVVAPAALVVLFASSVPTPGGGPPAVECPDTAVGSAPDPDLYCIDLTRAPGIDTGAGTATLTPAAAPFGAAVTVDGRQRHGVTVALRGLPDPSELGPYTTYVAWATTPMLRPMIKLGPVGAGGAVSGPVALNKFIVLVTAEASADVERRQGRLVLRGGSAGMRMLPHDDPLLTLGGAGPADRRPDGRGSPVGWNAPPAHPAVPMLPGMAGLRPRVSPFLPGAGVEAATLPERRPREVAALEDGDTLSLVAERVRRTIRGRTYVMYGFNGQSPGPLIEVGQTAEIVVEFENRLTLPTTVHWHGIRLDNRFDGVPEVTQAPVEPGGAFTYRVRFPDAGIYWYHPHMREDVQQDLGLYGNMLVEAPDPDYYGPANRRQVLMLDDLLIDEEGLFPYGAEAGTHALMGRFGNLLLVNGEPAPGWRLEAERGEVVRFYLTNVANTRTFNVSFDGASAATGGGAGAGASAPPREAGTGAASAPRMKVVGADVGKFEREEWVESVVIGPAQRYIVDVRFPEAGEFHLVNRVQGVDHTYGNFFAEADTLGMVEVAEERVEEDHAAAFGTLRENADVAEDIGSYREQFDRPVDHELVLAMRTGELPFPMDRVMRLDSAYFNPVEWSGTMPMMNAASSGADVDWILRDAETGAENMQIDWRFRVGDVVKVRITNERRVLHGMQHPIHIHGQRFLVLARNGEPNDNLVWKDTILMPVGQTADLLLELSNPGDWMIHCHIAEHLEAGMRMKFTVDGARPTLE